MNVIQTSTLLATARALACLAVLWCSAAVGAPPLKLPSPPQTPGLRVKVEQQQGVGFFYFVAALLALAATGLGIQAIRSKLPRNSWLLRSPLWVRIVGALFAIIVGTAFVLIFGSPNGKTAGALWLVAVFGACGAQLALASKKAADQGKQSPQSDEPRP